MAIPGLPPSLNQRLCCLTKDQTALRDEFEQQLATIQEEIEALEARFDHAPIDITSFTVSPTQAEIGSTVFTATFSWALNKTAETQNIDHGVGAIPPPGTSITYPVNITSSTTYMLTVDDGTSFPGHSDTATVTISLRHKAYWGTSANPSLDSAGILALSGSALTSGRARSFTVNGGGEYIYYAYPNSFDSGGDASFTVNGFPTSGWVKTTVNFTNASGNTTLFSVYRSAEVQSGSGITVSVT